jgi:hypothetical protein
MQISVNRNEAILVGSIYVSIVAASETVGSHSPRHLWSSKSSSYQTLIRFAKNAERAGCCGFCEETSVLSQCLFRDRGCMIYSVMDIGIDILQSL